MNHFCQPRISEVCLDTPAPHIEQHRSDDCYSAAATTLTTVDCTPRPIPGLAGIRWARSGGAAAALAKARRLWRCRCLHSIHSRLKRCSQASCHQLTLTLTSTRPTGSYAHGLAGCRRGRLRLRLALRIGETFPLGTRKQMRVCGRLVCTIRL